MIRFGERLKSIRTDKDLSQKQLAKISEVPASLICDIETGRNNNPTINTALKLAKALGCSVEDLTIQSEEAM